jgi:hypothetical protein
LGPEQGNKGSFSGEWVGGFICADWPRLIGPKMSVPDEQILHFASIVYVYFIVPCLQL